VGVKILYRDIRRPGEAGMKLVPDQLQRAAERKLLEGLGFTVIEITSTPVARVTHALLREYKGVR
jgi:hypothetical protein